MTFFFADTDVLVLITANYDRLPKNTSISMASRVQQLLGQTGQRLCQDSIHSLRQTTLGGLVVEASQLGSSCLWKQKTM